MYCAKMISVAYFAGTSELTWQREISPNDMKFHLATRNIANLRSWVNLLSFNPFLQHQHQFRVKAMVLIFNSTVSWNFRDKFHSYPCYYLYIHKYITSRVNSLRHWSHNLKCVHVYPFALHCISMRCAMCGLWCVYMHVCWYCLWVYRT